MGKYCITGTGNVVLIPNQEHLYSIVGRNFDTKEKAEKARDIMVRHDIILKYVIDHAPDFKFDAENLSNNYCVVYFDGSWSAGSIVQFFNFGTIFMPKHVAEKLAEDLNDNRIEGI